MLNSPPSNNLKPRQKQTERFDSVRKKIAFLEKKIRSDHELGDIKVRTTGKFFQLVWKRIDFLEFDQHWLPSMNLSSTESKLNLKFSPEAPVSKKRAVYREGQGFLYCSYKCVGADDDKKLILIKKNPILMASGNSRKKITKALNMLSKILSCSKELKNISLLLNLAWEAGIKKNFN